MRIDKKDKRKGILPGVLLLAITIIILFFLLETAVRIFNLAPDFGASKGMFQKDKLLDYSLTPNFSGKFAKSEFSIGVSTNSLGIRDVEYTDKKPNDYRILALGDSFTWGAYGTQLNQTFVKLLEKKLNKNPDKNNYQIINAGVPGYGTDQEMIYLENKGYKLKPDLVILNFFVGNDFKDNMQSGEFTVENGVLVSKNFNASASQMIRTFLIIYSHAYRVMEKGAIILFKDFIQKYIKGKIENDNYEKQLFLKPANAEISKEFGNTEKILDDFNAYIKSSSMKLVIVIIPLNYQVDNNQKQDFIKNNFNENEKYEMQLPQAVIKEWANKNNVTAIDLQPELAKIDNNDDLYWKLNGHFNANGNEAAAEIIYSELINNKNLTLRNK